MNLRDTLLIGSYLYVSIIVAWVWKELKAIWMVVSNHHEHRLHAMEQRLNALERRHG